MIHEDINEPYPWIDNGESCYLKDFIKTMEKDLYRMIDND